MQYSQITLAVLLMAIGANTATTIDFPQCAVRGPIFLSLSTLTILALMISSANLHYSITLGKRQKLNRPQLHLQIKRLPDRC